MYILKQRRSFIDRRNLGILGSASHIIQVKGQRIARYVNHIDVVDIDILYNTTPSTSTLKAQARIGTDKRTARHIDVFYATRHLAADDKPAMPMQHDIIFDNDIFAGLSAPTTFLITTRFQTDSIVAGIEETIRNQYVLARFHIEGIAVLRIPRIENLHVVHSQ